MPNSNQTLTVEHVKTMIQQRITNIDKALPDLAGTMAGHHARAKREAYEDTLIMLGLLPADTTFVVTAEKPS